jgi:sugar lactone lactonase YvrE
VYVSESPRVQYFSPGGSFIGKWGSLGSADGQFNRARGTAFSSNDTFYVVDSVNNRIQYFK